MAALTGAVAPKYREHVKGAQFRYPVADGVVIYQGALVMLEATGKWATPSTAQANALYAGVAKTTVDNSSGSNGDAYVDVDADVILFEPGTIAGTDPEPGDTVYAVTDNFEDMSVTDPTNGIDAGKVVSLGAESVVHLVGEALR